MRLLLAKKANPESPDRKGRTPVQCLLAPSFFDGDALHGQAHHATLRQRQTLQVGAVCFCWSPPECKGLGGPESLPGQVPRATLLQHRANS